MKNLLLLLLIPLLGIPQLAEAQKDRKLQKKYLPKELFKQKLYFGLSKDDLLKKFPKASKEKSSLDFRETYLLGPQSSKFDEVICYVDAERNFPVYEFILVLSEDENNEAIGRQLFGPPNYENKEWRFSPETTGLSYTIAAWTFQNKLVLAAAMPGTEWEEGF